MKAKVGDKKPCMADGCKKKAVCIRAYLDCCMGTLEEIWREEWECSCGAKWKQGWPE